MRFKTELKNIRTFSSPSPSPISLLSTTTLTLITPQN